MSIQSAFQRIAVIFIFLAGSSALTHAQSAPPNLIHFQSRIANSSGTPINGIITLNISIYNVPAGGSALWTETQTTTALNGVVNILLGATVSIPSTVFDSTSVFVALKVGSDPEMTPRRQLVAVPYARRAATANALETTTTIPTGLITGAHILDGTITAVDIAAGAITTAKISAGAVTSNEILDSTIATADLANLSVTTAKIADGAITSTKLAANVVNSSNIIDGSIVTVDIADGSITTAKLVDGSVTSLKLGNLAVTSASMGPNSVGSSNIIDGSIVTADLADGSVTSAKIAASAVTATDLAPNSVASSNIIDGTIIGADLADGAVTSNKIANASINSDKFTTLTQEVTMSVVGVSAALFATTTDTTNIHDGVHAVVNSPGSFPIWAENNSASGLYAVVATTAAPNANAVSGSASSISGSSRGVLGFVNSSSGFGVFSQGNFGGTGAKYFIQPHPSDPSKQVQFACLEGNESGTYFRGTIHVSDGLATIPVPEEFKLVTEPDSLTVTATPVGTLALVCVESESIDNITIRADRDVKVNYIVNGKRRGFAGDVCIRANDSFVPVYRDLKFGTQYPPAYRQILVQNGILNADFTPNLETAFRLGWDLKDPWTDPHAESLVRAQISGGLITAPPGWVAPSELQRQADETAKMQQMSGVRK